MQDSPFPSHVRLPGRSRSLRWAAGAGSSMIDWAGSEPALTRRARAGTTGTSLPSGTHPLERILRGNPAPTPGTANTGTPSHPRPDSNHGAERLHAAATSSDAAPGARCVRNQIDSPAGREGPPTLPRPLCGIPQWAWPHGRLRRLPGIARGTWLPGRRHGIALPHHHPTPPAPRRSSPPHRWPGRSRRSRSRARPAPAFRRRVP